MRRANALITLLIMILLLVHAVAGAFQLMGVYSGGQTWLKCMSWFMAGLVVIHMVIGFALTFSTLKALKQSGASCFRDNMLFWIRRISALALMLFIIYHITVFGIDGGGQFRLHLFGALQLAGSLLLVVSLVFHALCSIRPLAISLGARFGGSGWKDAVFVFACILLFCAAAFIVYYLRWNVLWVRR